MSYQDSKTDDERTKKAEEVSRQVKERRDSLESTFHAINKQSSEIAGSALAEKTSREMSSGGPNAHRLKGRGALSQSSGGPLTLRSLAIESGSRLVPESESGPSTYRGNVPDETEDAKPPPGWTWSEKNDGTLVKTD